MGLQRGDVVSTDLERRHRLEAAVHERRSVDPVSRGVRGIDVSWSYERVRANHFAGGAVGKPNMIDVVVAVHGEEHSEGSVRAASLDRRGHCRCCTAVEARRLAKCAVHPRVVPRMPRNERPDYRRRRAGGLVVRDVKGGVGQVATEVGTAGMVDAARSMERCSAHASPCIQIKAGLNRRRNLSPRPSETPRARARGNVQVVTKDDDS